MNYENDENEYKSELQMKSSAFIPVAESNRFKRIGNKVAAINKLNNDPILTKRRNNAADAIPIFNTDTINSITDAFQNRLGRIKEYKIIFMLILIMVTLYIMIFVMVPGWFFTDDDGNSIKRNDMSFNDKIINALYFSTTQASTIGFGDITPKTPACKVIVSAFNMLSLFISIGVLSLIGNDIYVNA